MLWSWLLLARPGPLAQARQARSDPSLYSFFDAVVLYLEDWWEDRGIGAVLGTSIFVGEFAPAPGVFGYPSFGLGKLGDLPDRCVGGAKSVAACTVGVRSAAHGLLKWASLWTPLIRGWNLLVNHRFSSRLLARSVQGVERGC